jgi:hypothetical protein
MTFQRHQRCPAPPTRAEVRALKSDIQKTILATKGSIAESRAQLDRIDRMIDFSAPKEPVVITTNNQSKFANFSEASLDADREIRAYCKTHRCSYAEGVDALVNCGTII